MKTGSSQPRSTALGPGLKRNSPERLLSLKRALPPGATAVTEAVSRTPGEIFGTNGEGTSIQDLSCAPRWAEGFSYRIPLKKKKKKRYFRAILGQLGFLVYHIVLFCSLYTVFSALNALLQHLPICPYRPHSNPILSMKPPWCLLCHRYYHPVRNHVIAYLFMLCHSFLSGKMGMIIVPIL